MKLIPAFLRKPVLPNILVLCMHKAASTFVADVLLPSIAIRTVKYDLYVLGSMAIKYRERELARAIKTGIPAGSDHQDEILARCLAEAPLPASNGVIGRLYPNHVRIVEQASGVAITDTSNRLVVVRRDPRDTVISLYYSLAISHDLSRMEGSSGNMEQVRNQLRGADVRSGIKTMLADGLAEMVFAEFRFCHDLIVNHENVCDLPYELLIGDPANWLSRFVQHSNLQRVLKGRWAKEIIPHLLPPEKEDVNSHKRRMKPGNWMDVFDDELQATFTDRIGPQMETLGYSW